MKRVPVLLLALAFCLCATQLTLAQKGHVTPGSMCSDCDPPPPTPTPTPTPLSCTSPNPIDDAFFFVQQQYRDFLNRDPSGAELAHDVAPLNSCLLAGDQACYQRERYRMSRTMWDLPEFRQQSRTFGLHLTQGNEIYNTYDFVELSYNIYLQRTSSDPPDDSRRLGFFFWKNDLDNCVAGAADYTEASQCYNHIIDAFLVSTEYRSRFGCP
jgi:hypothetical protein